MTAVVRTGVLPQINTGIAGKVAGTGQVGAGLVTPPMECFAAAIAPSPRRPPISRPSPADILTHRSIASHTERDVFIRPGSIVGDILCRDYAEASP